MPDNQVQRENLIEAEARAVLAVILRRGVVLEHDREFLLRFFDATFGIDDVRQAVVSLTVAGEDNFRLEGASSMAQISRDPEDLAGQMLNAHHRFPDGAVLFCGTMFAPVQDRGAPGQGFTHRTGDVVTISTPKLGRLVNRIRPTDACEPWGFGTGALMRNLAKRGLLG